MSRSEGGDSFGPRPQNRGTRKWRRVLKGLPKERHNNSWLGPSQEEPREGSVVFLCHCFRTQVCSTIGWSEIMSCEGLLKNSTHAEMLSKIATGFIYIYSNIFIFFPWWFPFDMSQ